MTFRVCVLLLLALPLAAEERWTLFRSGPFEVMTNAGDRPGREALNYLEQLRHTLGYTLGKQDLTSLWPIRIVIIKAGKSSISAPLGLARNAWTAAWPAGEPPPAAVREIVRMLIESNAGRMPAVIERGLADVYSTLDVQGTRVTLGTPLPPAERTLDWARVHMLAVHPDYSGKLRVLLGNLQQGVDSEPAYRNAFSKSPAEIEKEAEAYYHGGQFGTIPLSGRPINPEKELQGKPAEPEYARALLADVTRTPAGYQALLNTQPVEAREGLGLLGDKAQLAAAAEAGSKSARVWLEYARQLSDPAKTRAALQKAMELNSRWGEPAFLLALGESDSDRKLTLLKLATSLDPRTSNYWQALAEVQIQRNLFPDAARSWAGAERAAGSDEERAKIRQVRSDIERRRAEFEESERRRQAEERERDLQKLRDAAMAEVKAAEARVNAQASKDAPPPDPNRKVVPWWEGPHASGKIAGTLERVDCLSGIARLVIRSEGKLTQLVVRHPSQVVIMGGGEKALGCGVQRPARKVTVEYFPKPDTKLASAGDVAVVEFQ